MVVKYSLFNKAIILVNKNQRDKTPIKILNKVKALSLKSDNRKLHAEALLLLCEIHKVNKDFEKGHLIINELLSAYKSDSDIKNYCLKGLIMKAHIFNNQEQELGEINVYDTILKEYTELENENNAIEFAKVMYYKAIILYSFENFFDSIICYENILEKYESSSNDKVKKICLNSFMNLSEAYLIIDKNKEAITNIKKSLSKLDPTDVRYSIMNLLLFISGGNISENELLTVCGKISNNSTSWDWELLGRLIKKLPQPLSYQAECFINFFSQHLDVDILETELSLKP